MGDKAMVVTQIPQTKAKTGTTVDNNDGSASLSLFLQFSRVSIRWEAWRGQIKGALTGMGVWEAWSS